MEQHIANNVLEMIGNTPMVELTKLDTGLCRLFLKLENQNPGGSIKDRIGVSLIRDAEEKRLIKPGDTIIEATAGNTGIGLALVALMKGYKIILVIPDKMSQEKINHLRALGAEIVLTRSDVGKGHHQYYQDLAQKIAKDTGGYYVNQFENPANPLAHETTTGPEIWEQLEHDVDAVVVGVGSSGTITGLTHFFQKVSDKTEFILADPEGSVLAEYINAGEITKKAGSWLVEGIGEDFVPSIADFSLTKKAYTVSDLESFETVQELLKKEGLLAGSSSGTLLNAALKYCREQTVPKRVVTFACDSGNKYLSKMYNDAWMFDQGLKKRKTYGDLRDIISHRFEDNSTVFVTPDDTLQTVYNRMKSYEISQLPVLSDNQIVGIVDESDLLSAIYAKNYDFKTTPISKIMSIGLSKVLPDDSIEKLIDILELGFVAIVENENEDFEGIITKIDLINYLRNGKY
ncbi:pyridoxal-phosphate dependent enzyme [uncultured Bacteroides sp.]|uniref:pyridoxal-phosphate dependent enzyme n=1 Tax=uncultured Bacteroides sp. TaxID=162156 RepID=UPI002AAAEA84|nr:pyridoxal-phosphate dependent enzyme [uncultured Bacteroides sp.]